MFARLFSNAVMDNGTYARLQLSPQRGTLASYTQEWKIKENKKH